MVDMSYNFTFTGTYWPPEGSRLCMYDMNIPVPMRFCGAIFSLKKQYQNNTKVQVVSS